MLDILKGVHPVRAMATRMHDLAVGCRKVYGSLRLCFAFSPANPVAPMIHVLATRIRPRLAQCRCPSDHAYPMLRDASVVVCTWGAVWEMCGVYLYLSRYRVRESIFRRGIQRCWRISTGPQDIRFDVASAGRRTRCRGEALGRGRGRLAKAVRG